RREQPRGERFLAGASTCARQQLEQRGRPEQVQIVGIQMAGVAEPLSLLSSTSPTIFDACQTALVQGNGACCSVARANDPNEPDEGHQERGRRHREPPGLQPSTPYGNQQERTCPENRQTRIAQSFVAA